MRLQSRSQSLALSFRERQANSARKRNCNPKLSLQDSFNQNSRIKLLPKIIPRATSTLSTQSHLPVKQVKLKLPRLSTLPPVPNRQDSFVKNWPDKMLSVRERAKLRFHDRMKIKELALVKKLKQAQDELNSIQNDQRQTETELQVLSPPSSEPVKYKKSFKKSRVSDVDISSENVTPRSVRFSSRIHRKNEYSSDFTDSQFDKPVELKSTEAVTSLYESTIDPEQGLEVETYPCNNCGRPFVKTRLAKHRRACKKAKKPRKIFDSMKQRLTDTIDSSYDLKRIKTQKNEKHAPVTSNWKQQHEDFIAAIRSAKKYSQEEKNSKISQPRTKTKNFENSNTREINENDEE